MAPLDASDLACLRDDEVLIESTDAVAREHRIRVAARDSEDVVGARPTAWLLDSDARPVVWCVCDDRGGQGHTGRHESA